EPLMSRARLAALAACPGWGRTSWSRAWKVRSVPSSASADIAAVTSAVRNRRSASAQARRSMPSMPSVPLISANPSFVSSFTGLSFADLSACAAGLAPAWPSSTSPSPTRARPMWARGARSPLQPTEPNRGTNGVMPSLSIAIRASASTGRTPDSPIARVRARRSMVARTTSWSTGGPTPAACDRMRASWSSGCRSGAMRVPASAPKPVDTPYTGSRDAAAQSAQLRIVRAHVSCHFFGVGPRVLAQRPADRLANEEFAITEVGLDVRVQQFQVGLALEAELADDRNAPLPHVHVGAPGAHAWADLLRMFAQQVPRQPRNLIYVVPPGACHDHLFQHRHRVGGQAIAVPFRPGKHQGRIALLAVSGASPQLEDGLSPLVAGGRHGVEDSATDRSDLRQVDAAVRRRRFHVCLHAGGLERVSGRRQLGPQPLDHGARR